MNSLSLFFKGGSESRRHRIAWSLLLALVAWMPAARGQNLPNPTNSGIEHIVVVMMENRSFDHLLGWMTNANARQAGLTYSNAAGQAFSTTPLAPDFQGCDHPDPDHSYSGGRIEYNNGLCDGWLRAGRNDQFSIGYYTAPDLPFLSAAATNWTLCDNYFAAIMAETYPNRIYQHAAQTDRLENTLDISSLPTIWDRLADADVSRRYYFSDIPMIALWGVKYLPIARLISSFYDDCAAGTLPQVAFVEPKFFSESLGTATDDHPHADLRNGEVFLNNVYEAIRTSPNWSNTVMVINFDEWGGFFDHVPPQVAPIPDADKTAGNADGLRGFRVPCILISPFARRAYVSHEVFDHTSVLKMIEWRWQLDPLTVRDQTARNLAEALDFSSTNYDAPQFTVTNASFGGICLSQFQISAAGTNSISLQWLSDAKLQVADDIAGPWQTVTNATPPFMTTSTNAARFYRVVDKWRELVDLARQYGFPGF